MLVGKVPDPKSQVEQITIALIYKFMDDMDAASEELGGKRTFFAGEFERYAWPKLMAPSQGGFEMLALYSEAIARMNENPGVPELFRTIFKNAYLPYRDPETLRAFLKEINTFSYDHSEKLGDAFEYLLSVLGSQGDAGQFRTPRHIIDFLVEVVDPKKDERVLDPACGTAGFLISSYKHIVKQNTRTRPGDLLTADERTRLAKNFIGYDISPDMVRLSLVNLYLHGFLQPQIEEYDTLTQDEKWNEHADVILANPPFMSPKGGIKPHKRFSVQATRSEVLFVDFLIAVISLPAGVFQPYSGVKTSILVLDKRLAKRTESVLFVKIESDGFSLGAQRREIAQNDLETAKPHLAAWRTSLEQGIPFEASGWGNLSVVEKSKIAETGDYYNLSPDRYREGEIRETTFPLRKLSDVCETITDGDHQPPPKSSVGVPFLTISNLDKNNRIDFEKTHYVPQEYYDAITPSRKPRRGDILYSVTGSFGIPVIVQTSKPFCFQRHIALIRPSCEIDNRFLYSLLASPIGYQMAEDAATGVAQKTVSLGALRSFMIPIPPLDIQREIVAEIEGYQKIIDGARQVVESYKPRIPVSPDWPMVTLGEVICGKPKNGYSGKPVPQTTNVKVLSLSATTTGKLDTSHFKYLDEEISEDAACRCRPGDIYLQRGNTKELVGTAALFDSDEQGFIYPDLMIRVRADETKILTKYLLFLLQSPPVREYVTRNAVGAAGNMPKINQTIVEGIPFPLPDLATQQAIVAEIEAEQRLVDGNKELIRRFEEKIKATINRVWGEAV